MDSFYLIVISVAYERDISPLFHFISFHLHFVFRAPLHIILEFDTKWPMCSCT